VKYGIALGALNPAFWAAAVGEADRLGYESAWLPEHLVLPIEMTRSPYPGEEHPPVPPTTPVYDAFAYLSFFAGRTERIRLGTHVYNIGLRHPFVAARALQTLDIVSDGRAEFGIGASWLESEWVAAGLDFKTRGRRVDEAIAVCQHLLSEPVVEHHGEFFDFGPVSFEPKPVQKPWPPMSIGGESDAALRRAARADGWIGMQHTLESVAEAVARLRALRAENGREGEPFDVTVGAQVADPDDAQRWADAGVTRIIVSPWRRSPEAVDGVRAFAAKMGL
jgi:probable F420-dependent oxidoreductase